MPRTFKSLLAGLGSPSARRSKSCSLTTNSPLTTGEFALDDDGGERANIQRLGALGNVSLSGIEDRDLARTSHLTDTDDAFVANRTHCTEYLDYTFLHAYACRELFSER